MNHLTEQLAESQGVTAACAALGMPRSSLYRVRALAKAPAVPNGAHPVVRPAPPRTLSQAEREQVCEILNSERFQDESPREVYATLLEEKRYLCSVRTIYRILHERSEVMERRNQRRHPVYRKPELMATGSNQVWSWDITKLRGPSKGIYYYLYVIIDIFSRYVVGWMVAEAETAELAEQLIAETCTKQNVQPAQLTIHADNGGPMTAKVVAVLMADLGVAKSHSRPHVSNDNPYSEAQFKTLKYRPGYPDRFGNLADARTWSRRFFTWYNQQHHHTGLELLTPAAVHDGRAEIVLQQRQAVLQQAFQAHPERFVHGPPQLGKLPEAVWINPPKPTLDQSASPPDLPTQRLDCAEPTVVTEAGALPLASLPSIPYTTASGTEDSATLGSDTSADPVDDVAGQSHMMVALPASPSSTGLHCQQSEKPKRPMRRAPPRPALTASQGSRVAGASSLYTKFRFQVVSMSLAHSVPLTSNE